MCVRPAKKREPQAILCCHISMLQRLFPPMIGLCLLWASGCAGSQQRPTTPSTDVVQMEALRITARRGADGGYGFDVYDAPDLFKRATDLLNGKQCHEAVVLYDRLTMEFPDSRYVSAAFYNAGLCLQALGEFEPAAQRYAALRQKLPASEDYKHASLQYAEVLVQLERWGDVTAVADELLARIDLDPHERLESMARHSQALLGEGKLNDAAKHAKSSLSYFRTRPENERIVDEFFAAANNYVLAETFRLEGQAMAFPDDAETQQKVLIRRAELLLSAQREYFNTISFTNLDNLHWAAASGYRIGNMYDELWHAVMKAPVPAHLPPEGADPYHQSLAKLIKPLIRHAVRYWELTLMLIERTGMDNDWSRKTRDDLVRVRGLLLEQPPGPGGLPATPTPTSTPPNGDAVEAPREAAPVPAGSGSI